MQGGGSSSLLTQAHVQLLYLHRDSGRRLSWQNLWMVVVIIHYTVVRRCEWQPSFLVMPTYISWYLTVVIGHELPQSEHPGHNPVSHLKQLYKKPLTSCIIAKIFSSKEASILSSTNPRDGTLNPILFSFAVCTWPWKILDAKAFTIITVQLGNELKLTSHKTSYICNYSVQQMFYTATHVRFILKYYKYMQ